MEEWRPVTVYALIWIGWMMSFLDRMVMSLSLPFIGRDMHLDATSQGAIISAFFFGYALCQIPGGLLADRFGARKVMSIGIAWWSVFTTCTGLVGSYPIMLVLRGFFGVGEGCFPGASWKTIATYFPPKERATATAVQSTVNTLGPALASLVAAGIIASFGWRTMSSSWGSRAWLSPRPCISIVGTPRRPSAHHCGRTAGNRRGRSGG